LNVDHSDSTPLFGRRRSDPRHPAPDVVADWRDRHRGGAALFAALGLAALTGQSRATATVT
jgi:hypothetical protein